MDDLTQRALTQLNTATANHSDKQQREVEQRSLTEAPAFVTGFAGGKYLVERLGQEPTATGVAVTNGLLQTGRRVTTTGQFVDGVPRVKPVVSQAPAVEATGKIKYLFAAMVGGQQQFYVGGWQKQPVLVKVLEPAERIDRMKNLGGNNWLVDSVLPLSATGLSGKLRSFKPSGMVYESRLMTGDRATGDTLTLVSIGHSFFARGFGAGAIGGSDGLPDGKGHYAVAFQGAILEQGRTATVGTAYYPYLLPTFRTPLIDDSTSAYAAYACNAAGDRGVASNFNISTFSGEITYVYWVVGTSLIRIGATTDIPVRHGAVDVFDTFFSIVTDFDNPKQKAKFTASVKLFGSDGSSRGTKQTLVYGIPAELKATAVVYSLSYHP